METVDGDSSKEGSVTKKEGDKIDGKSTVPASLWTPGIKRRATTVIDYTWHVLIFPNNNADGNGDLLIMEPETKYTIQRRQHTF